MEFKSDKYVEKIKIISQSFSEKNILLLFLIVTLIIISKTKLSLNKDPIEKKFLSNSTFILNFINNQKNVTFFFNFTCHNHSYSSKFNIIEIIYYINIFDENKNLIKPFDLAFYYDLYIFCNLKLANNNYEISTLPNFYNNTNLICIEQFHFSERAILGIKIYQKNSDFKLISNFNYSSIISFHYKYLKYENNNKFSPFIIYKEHINIINQINKEKIRFSLKSSYIKNPSIQLRTSKENPENKWIFKNIYNQYFCFCKGVNCEVTKKSNIFQYCKYWYYLTIIDKNRDLYEKTEYLFADFIYSMYNADDTFPVFIQMIKQKKTVHYMTQKNNIYKEFCPDQKCWTIIKEGIINGDFLEKYLDLILRLKVTVAGAIFPAYSNLFSDIEYITSINVGHGVKFFKSFLYKDYTSPNKYNKLVLAPSSKIISVAKSFGWKDENIIKNCLPKWDKYNNFLNGKKYYNKKIFIFFTFREKKLESNKEERSVITSKFYLNNILNLLNNTKLNIALRRNNITLYFGLHHNLNSLKEYISKNFKFVKIINNELISELLIQSSLLVTDFSSVTFDFIYQRKPVIIYIPDYEDPEIKKLYTDNYYNLIKSLGNGTIYFENQYYSTLDVVDKIIFYINNNFKLEKRIEKF